MVHRVSVEIGVQASCVERLAAPCFAHRPASRPQRVGRFHGL